MVLKSLLMTILELQRHMMPAHYVGRRKPQRMWNLMDETSYYVGTFPCLHEGVGDNPIFINEATQVIKNLINTSLHTFLTHLYEGICA